MQPPNIVKNQCDKLELIPAGSSIAGFRTAPHTDRTDSGNELYTMLYNISQTHNTSSCNNPCSAQISLTPAVAVRNTRSNKLHDHTATTLFGFLHLICLSGPFMWQGPTLILKARQSKMDMFSWDRRHRLGRAFLCLRSTGVADSYSQVVPLVVVISVGCLVHIHWCHTNVSMP